MVNKQNSEANYYLKLLVKVSAFIFIATIISKLATYGYKIVIVRYFGIESYGLFSLALIVVGVVAAIASFGLNEGITRYVSFYRGKKDFKSINKLVVSSKIIFSISAVVCTILLIILSPLISEKIFHNTEFNPIFIGMILSLPFILFSGLYLSLLRGFEKIRTYSSLINIYQNITRLLLIIVLILLGVGSISIAISYTLTFIGLMILARHYSKKDTSSIKGIRLSNKGIMAEVLSYSWPLMFVGILYNIFYWSDSLILGYLTNAESVGLYNIAITLVSLFGIAPDLFMQLLFPLISFKLSEGKKELIKKIVMQVVKWIYLINIPLFIFLFLFPEKAIYLLFNINNENATNCLKILSIAALCVNLIGLLTNLLSIKGRTKLVLANFAIFSLINILLDFLLIPKYGMIGAATATFIATGLFVICLILQIHKVYGFNPLANYFYKLFFAGGVIFVLGYNLRNYSDSLLFIITICILSFILYLSLVYLIKVFDEEDKDIVKAVLRKTTAKFGKKV